MEARRWRGRVVLDWVGVGGGGDLAPCVLCGKPAIARSPKGLPCHKTCAEDWIEQQERAE